MKTPNTPFTGASQIPAMRSTLGESMDNAEEARAHSALIATYPRGINSELARVMAVHGVTADQISFHASDVRIGCPTHALASTIRQAGPWRSVADVYRTNPAHPDAKRFPWGVDVPFARLDHLLNEKRAARPAKEVSP